MTETENVVARKKRKSPLRICFNYALHLLARNLPGGFTLRPFLHRLRGVKIEKGVWIGEDVFIDGGFPEAIEIRENAGISMRCTIIGHAKGVGKVIIGKGAVLGAGSLIVCSSTRTLTIGECAVVAAGTTICNDVPPYTLCGAPRAQMFAQVTVPFLDVSTIDEFKRGLRPISSRIKKTPNPQSNNTKSIP
jgi:acetyltransferase-like isoleucine patch superfamily enzyme